jgi:hypothetical protein
MDRELVNWRKKAQALDPEVSGVHRLARQLGVERRKNPRVLYPKSTTGPLPAVSFEGQFLRAQDISSGGVCVHDPKEFMGNSVGIELTLTLHFPDGYQEVRCRLVGRVDLKRHMQFLDLPEKRAGQITKALSTGICASSLRMCANKGDSTGPKLTAKEIWSSLAGDSLTIEDDVHVLARASVNGRVYTVHKKAWPSGPDGSALSQEEMLGLVLFVANIFHPSSAVKDLLHHLETFSLEGRR